MNSFTTERLYNTVMRRSERHGRIIVERLGERGAAEQEFNRAFWATVSHESKFAAMWEMVAEITLIRGQDARQPRLQRSIQRVLRREC